MRKEVNSSFDLEQLSQQQIVNRWSAFRWPETIYNPIHPDVTSLSQGRGLQFLYGLRGQFLRDFVTLYKKN